jgi:hypothetical protein
MEQSTLHTPKKSLYSSTVKNTQNLKNEENT